VTCGLAAWTLVHERRLGYPKAIAAALCLLPFALAGLNYRAGFDSSEDAWRQYAGVLSVGQVVVGKRRLREGNAAEAERRYNSAIQTIPENGMAHRRLGALSARGKSRFLTAGA